MTIFIDLDGVLVSFLESACPIFGTTLEELMERWPAGVWPMDEVLGITANEFYEKIEAQGPEYWANCKPYPWTDELWNMCEKIAPTFILSTPTYDPSCLAGKLMWLQRWKGKGFRNYILTPHKERCARHDRLLIDDRDDNIKSFCEHGGRGILFPAHTNSKHVYKNNPMEYVREELEKWRSDYE